MRARMNKLTEGRATIPKMDNKLYSLRRKVIDIIYEAKMIDPTLPRINVRVVDNVPQANEEGVLAFAPFSNNSIFIDRDTFTLSDDDLAYVVLHEILHGVYNARHVTGRADIMNPCINAGRSRKWILEQFSKWVKKS